MHNTMAIIHEELGGKMKKGKEKQRKITKKRGKKALKIHLLGYKLQNVCPVRRKLVDQEKKN